MSLEKQAAEAVNMLMAEGVDFDSATDLVMEKIAGTAMDIAFSGYSNAERNVANQYGHEGPRGGWVSDGVNNVVPHMQAVAGGLAGGIVGLGAGARLGNVVNRPGLGALAGYLLGSAAGMTPVLKYQANKLHEKYREKQAAVNMLLENGLDFDSAVQLVNDKASELYGD